MTRQGKRMNGRRVLRSKKQVVVSFLKHFGCLVLAIALAGCGGGKGAARPPAAPTRSEEVTMHGTRGLDLAAKGELEAAILEFNEVLLIDPRDTIALYNRGAAYLAKQDYDKAVCDFTEAIRLNPRDAESHQYRGLVYVTQRKFSEAIVDFSDAVRIDPKLAAAYDSLAFLKSCCPVANLRNGLEAIEAARKACELTSWKNHWYLTRLAAAYAEAEDFEQAIASQNRALDSAALTDEDRREMKARLALYEQHQPYRIEP